MNIVLTIFGGFLTVIGLLAIWAGISLSSLSSLNPDPNGGKTVWLERSPKEPYFWAVLAVDDQGRKKFVDGYSERVKAQALFDGISNGSISRKWVRENDEERTRQQDEARAKENPYVLIEAK